MCIRDSNCIEPEMIKTLASVGSPLIVGGGIKTIEHIKIAHNAGANLVVIGNKIEEDIDFLLDLRNITSEASL